MSEGIGHNPEKIKYVKGEFLEKLKNPEFSNLCAMVATKVHPMTAVFRQIADNNMEGGAEALSLYETFNQDLNDAIDEVEFTEAETALLNSLQEKKYQAKNVFMMQDAESNLGADPLDEKSTNFFRRFVPKIEKIYDKLSLKYGKNLGVMDE